MDEISRSIASNVKSGSYFRDAREWYNVRYILPITQRSRMALMAVLALLGFVMAGVSWVGLFPLDRHLPLALSMENIDDYFTTISSLETPGESSYASVAKYLLTRYLGAYEGYAPALLEQDPLVQRLNDVKNNSSARVYRAYYMAMNTANPDSPLLRYGNQTQRNIQVTAVHFVGDGSTAKPTRATIDFQATEAAAGQQPVASNWEADVAFTLGDITAIHDAGVPVGFQVTDYTVRQIGN